jgi:succinate dehydrogenase / fumarate reductase cytochrome b subunit
MSEKLESNFFLRRLHSLTGIMPVGLFLVFHLFANSTAIFSAENYNTIINFLRSLPFVTAIEWLALYIPIGFHALYGLLINSTARPNQWQYPHLENWRYVFQRLTGFIALLYILYHIWQFKFVENLDYDYIAKSMAAYQSIPNFPEIPWINPFSVYWFYIIGVTSIVYHFANGVWGFCITWGITVGAKSQKIMSLVSLGLFIVFAYIGIMTTNHLHEAGLAMIDEVSLV